MRFDLGDGLRADERSLRRAARLQVAVQRDNVGWPARQCRSCWCRLPARVRVTVRGLEQDVILASKVVVAGVSIMCRLSPGLPTGRRSYWCRSFLRDRPRHCRFITERRHNHRHGNHQCQYSNAASPAKVTRCTCSDYVVIRLGESTTRPRGRARRLSQLWSHAVKLKVRICSPNCLGQRTLPKTPAVDNRLSAI